MKSKKRIQYKRKPKQAGRTLWDLRKFKFLTDFREAIKKGNKIPKIKKEELKFGC